MRVGELAKFMIARDTARQNKEAGQPKPWTKDKIIQTYRFCNVHREDDAVSRWLRRTYYPSFKGHQDIGFAAVVARLLNNPDALYAVAINRKFVLPWKPEMFRQVLHTRKAEGKKNFNAAYIVSTNGVAMDKVDYLSRPRSRPAVGRSQGLRPRHSLAQWHEVLMEYDGLGSFIAAQVIADLKYMPPLFDPDLGIPTSFADDWYTFAASGPGSRRGLNRVIGYAADSTVEGRSMARCARYPLQGSRPSCRSTSATASTRRTCRTASASLTSTSASG
jgi:hypothetical protein